MTDQELANRSLRSVNGVHPKTPKCSSKEHEWEVIKNAWGTTTSRCKNCGMKSREDSKGIMYLLDLKV